MEREVSKAFWLKTLFFFCLLQGVLILLTKLLKRLLSPRAVKNFDFFLIIVSNYVATNFLYVSFLA